jgi:hypothetical protein
MHMKRRALTLAGLMLIVTASFAQTTSTITALPAIVSPAGTDVYGVDQSGCGSGAGTCKESLSQLATWLASNLGLPLSLAGGGNVNPSCMPSSCSATGFTLNSSGIGLPAAGDIVVPGAIYTNQQYTYNHARIFLPNGELFFIDLSEGTGNTEWCIQQDNYSSPFPPNSSPGPNGGSLAISTCGDNDGAGANPFIGAVRSGINIAAIYLGNLTDSAGGLNIFVHGGLVSAGTPPTLTGCSFTTQKGGEQTGSFVSGTSGTCTVTISNLPDTSGGQTGWWCSAFDETHPAALNPTADTNSSCTISGATTSGDKIVWHAFGY